LTGFLASGSLLMSSSGKTSGLARPSSRKENRITLRDLKPDPVTPGRVPERAEIDARYKWDLADIFSGEVEWETEFRRVEARLPEFAPYRGRLGESGPTLLEFFRLKESIEEALEQLAIYACLLRDEDTRVPAHQAMADRVTSLSVRAGEALSFVDPELLALPDGRLDALVRAAPGLALYAHALDDLLRKKPHTLPENEERLLAMSADFGATPSTVFGMFNNADLKFGVVTDEEGREIELTHGRYSALQKSRSRTVRESAWRTMLEGYRRFENTLAANMSGSVKRHQFVARARSYDSCLAAALDRDNIPTAVYRNLVRTVREEIAPLHRYMELRRRVLGVELLEPWDLGAPLVPEPRRAFPFDEAVATVRAGIGPLGPEYGAAYDEGVRGGWIDVLESQGKRSGAYSWGGYSTKPYLLLNYNDTRDDLFTLAHEMGHSIHSLLTRRTQPYVYGGYSIFVAEVASTTNEALLVEKLLEGAEGPDAEASILNHYLDQIRGTFFVQTMFADFELGIHEMVEAGEALTAAALGALFGETYAHYHGPAFRADPLQAIGWARIPHFYYNFYVFQYATSYAAATAIASRILRGEAGVVDRYVALLKSGGSDYPIGLLAKAGVDMTTAGPVRDTIARFSAILDRLEAVLPACRAIES